MHLILVRHARSSANAEGVLAGRSEGVHLDEDGRVQAEGLTARFEGVEISAIVGSPMVRCRETAEALCINRRLKYEVDQRLNEVDYGQWSGRKLSDLAKDPLWKEIQATPTTVTFPRGESMRDLFDRSAEFVESQRGRQEDEIVLAFSHGDVIKAILAHCYAMSGDDFQRIIVDPSSVSVVRLSSDSTFVVRTNDGETTLAKLLERKAKDAVVGGETK